MPLTQWLQRLGLEQYASLFADNDIDHDTLPELSDEDLKEIGICSLGHRKKLLAAIRALTSEGEPAEGIPLETDGREWSNAISRDEGRWFFPAFEKCPLIIASEYKRLRDLLWQGQTYGAWLQMKDIFEIIIKFPLLVGAACLYHRKERSSAGNKILLNLMEKALSLGDWKRIGDTMLKNELQAIPALIPIQRDVAAIFGKRRIVQWRNENIGHGALGFDTGKKFRQDFEEKLAILEAHFAANAKPYGWIKLVGMDEDGGTAPLVGIDGGEEVHALNGGSPGLQTNDAAVHPLTPYFVLQEKGLFFYDSFYRSKKLCAVLDYMSGAKQSRDIAEVRQIYDALVKESDMERADTDDAVTGMHYRAEFDKILDKLADIDDFQKPKFLETWLKDAQKQHDRGVFLLRMERGTGKTTFARSLNDMQMHRVKLDGFTVRGYSINDSYLHKPEIFRSKLVHSHLNVNRDGRIFLQGDIPTLSESAEDKRQKMSEVLNFFRREFAYHRETERLLVILDGLDEIPAGDGPTIFDFIPDSSLLDAGVYILLTCRTEEEISDFTKNQLESIALDADVSFFRQEKASVALMTTYIRSWQQRKIDPATIGLILEKAENRFAYLKTIRELLRVSGMENLEALPQGEDLVRYFLDYLKDAYGEKYFQSVARLLVIISTAFEPLTIGEISYLFGEDAPTFRLLAYLTDIKGFLKAERGYEGNLFSISQEAYERLFKDYFADLIGVVVREWVEGLVAKEEGQLDAESAGEFYLGAFLMDYCNAYLPGLLEEIVDEDMICILRKVGGPPVFHSQTRKRIEREKCLCGGLITLYELMKICGKKIDENRLSGAYNARGYAFHHLQETAAAITDFDRAIEIRERLHSHGKLMDENDIAIVYINRSIAFRNRQSLTVAIADSERAIEIRERLHSQSRLMDENDLADAYMNRGNYMKIQQDMAAAIADYDRAIAIRERLHFQGRLLDENDLAKVYANRGLTFSYGQEMTAAIADYDRTIEIMERLHSQGRLMNENDLATAYLIRGDAFFDRQDLAAAIVDCDRAIEIRERLHSQGRLMDENDLAKGYIDRANAFRNRQDLTAAIADCDRAIEIRERLHAQGRLMDENDLAIAYMERGVAFKERQDLAAAIADYESAIEIRARLDAQGRLMDENDLAKAYMERGIALRSQQQPAAAIAEYDRAIEIRERLHSQGRLSDENDLAILYMNRGAAFSDRQKLAKAISDYDRAIEIQERLHSQDRLLDENDLAIVYFNRGLALSDRQEMTEAFLDYDRAIEIQERLYSQDRLLDENGLATAYFNRGFTFSVREELAAAIADYDRAIEIRERLHNLGRLMNENDLEKVYIYRGNALRNRQELTAAIADFERAIEIKARIGDRWVVLIENRLAEFYMNRGLAFSGRQELAAAIADYDRAIGIRERLLTQGRLMDEDDLATVLINRGNAFKNQQELPAAISDYERAIEIRERLHNQGELFLEENLASVYEYRGVAFVNRQDLAAAISDYDRAIEIRERLHDQGSLIDEGGLASVYEYRAHAFYDQQELEATIADFERAIEIREQIHSQGRLINEIGLARSYFNLACLGSIERDLNSALENLESCFQKSITFTNLEELEADDDLANLRKDPRYPALIAKYFGENPASGNGE